MMDACYHPFNVISLPLLPLPPPPPRVQAIGSFKEKPTYKQLEAIIQSAREAKLEIFQIARKASSLDREAVSLGI
jgi:hypothetical protein